MERFRNPAVAGKFYPANAMKLQTMVRGFMNSVQVSDPVPKAIIVPHAGYIYSGPIAASAYACVASARSRIKRVVILGPAHYVPFRGIAYDGAKAFLSPLGSILQDCASLDKIKGLSQVQRLEAAHDPEHSLEVQFPFLQELLGDFVVIPLVVGEASPMEVAEVIEFLWGTSETLIVVSSDLSHYLDYETARNRDAATAKVISSLSFEELQPGDACGIYPIQGLLYEARRRHMTSKIVDLRNSGDTAGPREQVVGYGAFLFTE